MKITKTLFDELNNAIPIEPPETGGILGSTDGEVIDCFIGKSYENAVMTTAVNMNGIPPLK